MSDPDASTFDFWLGEWDCTFDGGHAVNVVTREHRDNVIVERFAADVPRAFRGTSVSVFTDHDGSWRQTWVDDAGCYWAFEGGLVDGNPSFGTPVPVDAVATAPPRDRVSRGSSRCGGPRRWSASRRRRR